MSYSIDTPASTRPNTHSPVRRAVAMGAGIIALTAGCGETATATHPAYRNLDPTVRSIAISIDSIGRAALCPADDAINQPCLPEAAGDNIPMDIPIKAFGWSGRRIGVGGEPQGDIAVYQRGINNAIPRGLLQTDGSYGDGWTPQDTADYSKYKGDKCSVYVLPSLGEARLNDTPKPNSSFLANDAFKQEVEKARTSITELADQNNQSGHPTVVVDMKTITKDPANMQSDGVHPKLEFRALVKVQELLWQGVSNCQSLLKKLAPAR